jgi:hypothetical protein
MRKHRIARYSEGEIGRLRVIEDFLPPPDKLVPREENVKVTLFLSRRSVSFFKREAEKRRVPYQRMIRLKCRLKTDFRYFVAVFITCCLRLHFFLCYRVC